MRIIISPAKQMMDNTDIIEPQKMPVFQEDANAIMKWMQGLTYEESKKLWGCNDKIARQNFERFTHMDLHRNLTPEDTWITCTFCELVGEKQVQKGVYAKMARGEMVRFMAERNISAPQEMKKFNRLGYQFREELSCGTEYVFIRN